MRQLTIFCSSCICLISFVCSSVLAYQGAPRFGIDITGLYLQPGGTNGDLNIESQQFVTEGTSIANLLRFEQDYKWGSEIGVEYFFGCSPDKISLNYFHFDSRKATNLDLTTQPTTIASYTFSNLIADSSVLDNFISLDILKYQLNQFKLSLSHCYVVNGSRFSLAPNFGIGYFSLKHNLFTKSSADQVLSTDPLDIVPLALSSTVKSYFRGIGPQIGIDCNYSLGCGFALTGRFAGSFFIGMIDSKVRLEQTLNSVLGEVHFTMPDSRRLVTAAEGKLGLNYNYHFGIKSSVIAELGYMGSKYYDAIDLIRGDVQSPFVEGEREKITHSTTNNFYLTGPYAQLSVQF